MSHHSWIDHLRFRHGLTTPWDKFLRNAEVEEGGRRWEEKNFQVHLLSGAKAPHPQPWNEGWSVEVNTHSQSAGSRSCSASSPILLLETIAQRGGSLVGLSSPLHRAEPTPCLTCMASFWDWEDTFFVSLTLSFFFFLQPSDMSSRTWRTQCASC